MNSAILALAAALTCAARTGRPNMGRPGFEAQQRIWGAAPRRHRAGAFRPVHRFGCRAAEAKRADLIRTFRHQLPTALGIILALAGCSRPATAPQAAQLLAVDPRVAAALAARHDPQLRRPDPWGRPAGWARFDLRDVPDLGLAQAPPQTAEAINALRPFSRLPIRPMKPFVLQTDAEDRGRALTCLAQAVYYEAAREPVPGQQAVAQVVLNRLRHPAYPKSICGVVYQGAARPTGCQFTFTCNGALKWSPQPALWRQALGVASRALAGYVDRDVGSATHYHAAYVTPYWAPTLVKMTSVGQHIFYRWTGPWGEPAAFSGRYGGHESELSAQLLASDDPRMSGVLNPERQGLPAARKVTLAVAGEVRTYTVADPNAADGQRTRVIGTLQPSRRQPTPNEVKAINDNLAAMEKSMDAPAAAAPSEPAAPTPKP